MTVNTRKLKHLAQIRASNVDKKSMEGDIPVKLCNYVDVYKNEIITSDLDFMSATATEVQTKEFELRSGDVLITKDSETPDDIGVPAYVPENLPGTVCGYHLSLIRPNQRVLDPEFLAWVLRSKPLQHYFRTSAAGITRFALNHADIAQAPIPDVSIGKQQSIARFLDERITEHDRLLQKHRQLLTLVDEKRNAVVSHTVLRGCKEVPMKDSGVDWMGQVPEHWAIRRIKHVARLASGHTPSRREPLYWTDRTIPWFQLTDIWQFRDDSKEVIEETAEMVSELGVKHSSAELLPAGTVALSRTASVGFSAILGVDMATTQDFANWIPGPPVRSAYLLYVLRAMRPEFQRLRFGSTHKTIYMRDIGKFVMPLPPLEEQDLIVESIRAEARILLGARGKLQEAIAYLEEYRSALISAAVSGEIDVGEAA